jgi:hypothetical protein
MTLGPITLANAHVRLRPFDPASDGAELYALAQRAPPQTRATCASFPCPAPSSPRQRGAARRLLQVRRRRLEFLAGPSPCDQYPMTGLDQGLSHLITQPPAATGDDDVLWHWQR